MFVADKYSEKSTSSRFLRLCLKWQVSYSRHPPTHAIIQEVEIIKEEFCIDTFKLASSFPARAKSNVDFPEPGGPKSNAILSISQTGIGSKFKRSVSFVQSANQIHRLR